MSNDVSTNRAIDAAIAEKVMGWTNVRNKDGRLVGLRHWDGGQGVMVEDYVPDFSGNIGAAFDVVFAMRRAGYYSQHTDLTMDSGQEDWHWKFFDYMTGGGKRFNGRGPLPFAICTAALRAMGVEVNNA